MHILTMVHDDYNTRGSIRASLPRASINQCKNYNPISFNDFYLYS